MGRDNKSVEAKILSSGSSKHDGRRQNHRPSKSRRFIFDESQLEQHKSAFRALIYRLNFPSFLVPFNSALIFLFFFVFLQNISDEKFEQLFEALKANTYLEILSLTNVGMTDHVAMQLAEALEENKTLRVVK